jgi:hypothetical protein
VRRGRPPATGTTRPWPLVDGWREWIVDQTRTDLLGPVDWESSAVLGPILADRTALRGDGQPVADLRDLDGAAADAINDATERIGQALALLSEADAGGQRAADELTSERSSLLAQKDPAPGQPAWITDPGGVPLWRCLDFAEDVDARRRAGIAAGPAGLGPAHRDPGQHRPAGRRGRPAAADPGP